MINHSLIVRFLLFLFLLVLTENAVKSQTCTGSLGEPVINIDFGRGASFYGPGLGFILPGNDFLVGESPEDGQYTIAKSTSGMNPGWYLVQNHTPNDVDGYMMVVNANETPGVFYESDVPIDLCPNTTYEFAAWVSNLLKDPNGNKPNITFLILTTTGQVLKSFNTGDIPNNNPVWQQYGTSFNTTAVDKVKIRMINNGPGGGGNDIALDDITFRPCGPEIIPAIDDKNETVQNMCEGENRDFKLSALVNGSPTLQYQWQVNSGNGWTDITGETGTTMTAKLTQPALGTYQYRLATAEPGNFNSVKCRTLSPLFTIKVNPLPNPVITGNRTVCLGDKIALDVSGTSTDTYVWTGPDNYSSTVKSPVIDHAANSMGGIYKVKVTSAAGCSIETSTIVNIVPPPVAKIDPILPICKGNPVSLNAHGGTSYRWSPAAGLSAANIANPIATPDSTTLYTVYVSNGGCETSAQIEVVVLKNPMANAGAGKKIIKGDSFTLNGTASGDFISYYWTPADYLDDPNKLNPVATPPADITYTLNVVSDKGCPSSASDVFIKVYEKLIVPKSFSPNGDGINDIWNITAIDAYPSAQIKVMNRYGELIFQGSGDAIPPWDGKYRNTYVPTGVYYYLIKLNGDLKPLSGSVTVIR